MDRLQQSEMLAKLLSSESRRAERVTSVAQDSSPSCAHWSGPVLLERIAYLRSWRGSEKGPRARNSRPFRGTVRCFRCDFVVEPLKPARGLLSSSLYWKGRQR